MSIHGLIDDLAIGLGAKFIPKYFREGIESTGLKEHLQGVKLEVPEIKGEGDYDVSATTLVGELSAGFRITRWIDESAPVIIYHHGACEIPFDYGFKGIFLSKKQKIQANLIVIRAPFHGSMKEFQHGIRTLANVVSMLSVSVCLIDHVVKYCKELKAKRVLVAGASLGGFITNLHHIHYNSADVYTPLLAGLAMDDAYLHSTYSKAVAPHAKENPANIESTLNFEADFAKRDNSNVYPLLATFDRIIKYERQKASYGECSVESFDKGHTTGALAYNYLRQHVLKHLG